MTEKEEKIAASSAAAQFIITFGIIVLLATFESIALWYFPRNRTVRLASNITLGLFFVGAGYQHFKIPKFYLKLMPPFLPLHLELVYLSGVVEIVFGLLMFYPRTANIGAWGVLATLLAVYPANIYHLFSTDAQRKLGSGFVFPLIRVPLQFVFFAWAYLQTELPLDVTIRQVTAIFS
eukprot:TRINITY_DN22757_c0_g1_i1.p1 TRINITY_DN22757_c0_g1~~TRINITY_DN22757_c0_g1_i1.p1  ORF type:complete len:178 (-),score=39.01 TRINITY_DN22757_c0_g1_i1:86-619(-)